MTDDTPASAPKKAPEPLSNTAPAVPSKDAEIVPTGVTSNIGNESTGQEATSGNESLDSIPGDIPAPPPHIAQRLEEHREQVSALCYVVESSLIRYTAFERVRGRLDQLVYS